MIDRLAIACAIAVITLLGFFVFPGHTFLHSDTQIYVPMMEHIWDPSTFPRDLVATKPHLSYTIYDEVAIGIRRLTGASFETALVVQQVIFRALQILGYYLLATALPLPPMLALIVTAIAGLGASIAGPSVLLTEYEPVPRGFAVALVFLAMGLAAHDRHVLASSAASLGFLYHAPTTIPFWLCFFTFVIWRRRWRAFVPVAMAVVVILIAAHFQVGVFERQKFLFRLDSELERLQKLRAAYNWVGNWVGSLMWQYGVLWVASMVAFWRVRPQAGRIFWIGLPIIGLLSVPASYVLLDVFKWGLISEVQPARALLFVTAVTILLGAAAGIRAGLSKRYVEAVVWFVLLFAIPMRSWATWPDAGQWLLVFVLALSLASLVRWERIAWTVPLGAFLLIPYVGRVQNYPQLETTDLVQLENYARENTPKDAMFLFAGAGHRLEPGIFRARALRSVYVDWKSGGQVNYYRSLAEEWWMRWEQVNELKDRKPDVVELAGLGIDYLVSSGPSKPEGLQSIPMET